VTTVISIPTTAMAIMATLWSPYLSPIGRTSIIALMVAATIWLIVERLPVRSARSRAWLTVLAPLPLLLIVLLSKLRFDLLTYAVRYSWQWRSFPNAEDYVAHYIYIAVACVLAWKARGVPFRDLRAVGILWLCLVATLLACEAYMLYQMYSYL
jgi:hypothetical protein